MTAEISRVSAEQATQLLPDFVSLLRDAVDGGAFIGFLPPLSPKEAEAYWRENIELIRKPNRILLIARKAGVLSGTVQHNLETRPNGRHRAEVMKLIVHCAYRRHGLASTDAID